MPPGRCCTTDTEAATFPLPRRVITPSTEHPCLPAQNLSLRPDGLMEHLASLKRGRRGVKEMLSLFISQVSTPVSENVRARIAKTLCLTAVDGPVDAVLRRCSNPQFQNVGCTRGERWFDPSGPWTRPEEGEGLEATAKVDTSGVVSSQRAWWYASHVMNLRMYPSPGHRRPNVRPWRQNPLLRYIISHVN